MAVAVAGAVVVMVMPFLIGIPQSLSAWPLADK